MIISHRLGFIFIKTVKTAGTSLEIALSQFCGDRDVITPIKQKDEQLRRELKFRGPQNFELGDDDAFFNHIDAFSIKRLIGNECWNNYFKFCFERNPWDKVVSWYFWRNKKDPRPTLADFVESDEMDFLRTSGGYNLYAIDGEVCVDRVFCFEGIESELIELSDCLKLPRKLELPRAKVGFRKDGRHYREFYDERTKGIVAEIFEREIKLFGYSF